MYTFDENQKSAIMFYVNQFKNHWERYDEIAAERNEKKSYLKRILSEESIDSITEEDVDEIIKSLWTGTLFPKKVAKRNSIEDIRKSLKFLLYGQGEPFDRLEKVCNDPEYKINHMGPPRIS